MLLCKGEAFRLLCRDTGYCGVGVEVVGGLPVELTCAGWEIKLQIGASTGPAPA